MVELAEELERSIREAAREGKALYEMEKDTFGRVLQIGHAAIEQLLSLQGDGDLGESVVTADGRRLERSEEPAERSLRTVFGEHALRAYVYAAGESNGTLESFCWANEQIDANSESDVMKSGSCGLM